MEGVIFCQKRKISIDQMCYKRRFIITNKFKTESISLEQYIKTNNNSNIIIPVDYMVGKHEEELRVARLLKDKIGGTIHILNEKQIWNNPGGIVLDIKKRCLEEDEIVDIAFNRINRSYHKIDAMVIILIENSNILKIIRLNK